MTILPGKLKREILNEFVIQGAVPVTESRLIELIDSRFTTVITSIESRANNVTNNDANGSGNQSGFPYIPFYRGDGSYYHVPQDFKFPSQSSCGTICRLWFFGDAAYRIGPHKIIFKIEPL